jgi:DNA-binding transcriptional regulator/RsmH inhibitor MraZ
MQSQMYLVKAKGIRLQNENKKNHFLRVHFLSTGIVRRVDNLGRIVLPKELRDSMYIVIKDSLAIYVEDRMIILKK